MTNFSEYWKVKGPVLLKLGIDKDSAYMIWCDALDAAVSVTQSIIINKQ